MPLVCVAKIAGALEANFLFTGEPESVAGLVVAHPHPLRGPSSRAIPPSFTMRTRPAALRRV